MTDMNLLADSYDAAADYIEQNGWHQGSITTIENESECTINEIVAQMRANKLPACAVGAAYAVGCSADTVDGYGIFAQINAVEEWHDSLKAEIGDFVATWNDEPRRTKEEVTDLLRMTALKIRMGNIGDNPREYEFEPMPASEPVVEPAAPQPAKEPLPA